jgi:hypothetical protein
MSINFKEKPTYDKFLVALKIGQLYEDKAIAKLLKFYKNEFTVIERRNDSKYDVRLSNNDTFEVKADILASKTGNIFIETVQFKKPSGIEITEAAYYIIIFISCNMFKQFETFNIISVERLKEMIQNKMFNSFYSDKFKSGYLFDVDVIKTKSILI